MKRLVLASGNLGKLREFEQLLVPKGWEVVSQTSLSVQETDEPFTTFVENALRKARNASAQTGLPALADDSGICVPALGGAPGVYSARYASRAGQGEGDQANNRHLVCELKALITDTEHPLEPKLGLAPAFYYCVLVWVDFADDPCPKIAEGRWWGEVLEAPKGERGFGYDPYFLIPQLGLTAAQMSVEEKNQVSHRAQALRRLVDMLQAPWDGAKGIYD
jgi:XTP/dITP diphosphohydrolase